MIKIGKGKKYPYEEYHKEVDGILYKKCAKHNNYFPDENSWFPCTSEYFYINKKNSLDGLHPTCKRCDRERAKIYGKEHAEQQHKTFRRWHKANKKYINDWCKEWRKNNQEHKQKYQLEYQRKNPEKIAEYRIRRQHKNHKITNKEWEACKQYFNHRCVYCGLAIEEHYITYRGVTKLGDFHKEHVEHDGENDLSNCVPSCKGCNDQKWKHELDKWYNSENPNFTEERYNKIKQWLNEDYKIFVTE